MRILDAYLGRAVITGTLLALFTLLGVDMFFAFTNEVQDLGVGTYGLGDAVVYVLLTVPRRIHELFPMAALLGSLLSLGALAATSELVAIRAAGVSILRITQSVLKAGLIMLALAAVLGEWLAPWAEQQAQQRRGQAQAQTVTFQSAHGFWARDKRRYVNIREILPDARLRGVQVYELADDGALRLLLHAESAEHVGDGWRLQGVRRGDLQAQGFELTRTDSLDWPSLLSPELLSVVSIEPRNLSARDLYHYAGYLRDNALDAGSYELAFWRRLVAPIAGLVMLFLSIPFVFGPLRDVGTGQRLLWGVLTGVAFYLFNQTTSHLGLVYGMPPLLSALIPSLVFFGGGLWMLRRLR
ncbi:MAG: LPS export ABC transporter permease LptG [Gammaproteobacteria bacterium]